VGIVPEDYIIAGIERGKEFIIPANDAQILPNDLVYLFGDDIAIHHFCKTYGEESATQLDKIVIFGANALGIMIAKYLIKEEKDIKLIDSDIKAIKKADELLEGKVTTIIAKYGTMHLYEEEGLKYADAVIAAGNNDEFNIIKTLEAKQMGVKKVIAINNDLENYSLMHSLGIIAVRGPKISAYNAILEHIYSTDIVTEKNYCGGKGHIYLHKILDNSPLIGKTIKVLESRENMVIYLIRDNKIYNCSEKIECQVDDVIIAFCTEEYVQEIEKWMHKL